MEKVISEIRDMTYLSWAKVRNSSGTAGSFLKSYEEENGTKVYYKLSDYDAYRGIVGHECVNEIIVDRLLTILGIEHLEYSLIHANILIDGKKHTTWLCASKDFKKRGESKIALDAYYSRERLNESESPLDFCIRCGWEKSIYEMLAVDYLILNRDRHGANIEVLRNASQRSLRLAPLFDHGLSLLCRCQDTDSLERENILDDKRVQSFVGSQSAFENLKLIPADKLPDLNPISESDKDVIVGGLEDALDRKWLDRIWDMIWKRWQVYADFCCQRR